mmetsp:Transcript_11812/g.21905  ORF Transcript_11812/g.21905 Transcript_11812/m.21905 type:complete len:358 (+) Transcript_11812:56-1129(+)
MGSHLKPILIVVAAIFVSNYHWLKPWILLFNGDREVTLAAWKEHYPINDKVMYHMRPIAEVQAADATVESMEAATGGYRRPAVIRGLYSNSTAVQEWNNRDYLPAAFGEGINIPVVKDGSVGTLQDDRKIDSFGDSFHRVFDSEYSKEYLFFPAKSRFTFKGVEKEDADRLEARSNEVVQRDLDLGRIRPGFGASGDAKFVGAQFVIGKSPADPELLVTGSDFHCAVGNNWFIQVVGRKRWEFIAPEYSASVWPLKGGMFNFWTGNKDMESAVHHIPSEYVDLEPGDVLFNPPWQWHKITNFEGLSIGVPVREKNTWNTLTNNPYFALTVVTNLLLDKVGLGLHGYPPPSAATEHDN